MSYILIYILLSCRTFGKFSEFILNSAHCISPVPCEHDFVFNRTDENPYVLLLPEVTLGWPFR